MPVYCAMLAVSVLFACAAMACPQALRYHLEKSGRIVELRPRSFLAVVSFLPLFLVSAFRYYTGVDYAGYVRIFQNVLDGKDIYAETGFEWLNKLVAFYSDNVQWIFAITAAFALGLIFWGIYRYSPNPALSVFLFVTMGYYFSSFNILRQYMAISMIFVSLKFIKEKKFWRFLAVILVGMLFHKTAIIMLPFYFLVRLRLKQSYLLILTLCGLALTPFRDKLSAFVVGTFYPHYAETGVAQPLSTSEFIYYLVVFGAVIFLCMKYREKFFEDEYNLILFNCVFYSFLIYLCLSFIPEVNRLAVYLEFFVILLIPRLFAAEENAKVRRFYTVFTGAAFLLFFAVSVGVMGRYNVLPYQTVSGWVMN